MRRADPRAPKLAKAGWLAAQLYRHLLMLLDKYEVEELNKSTATPEWIADEWNLRQPDLDCVPSEVVQRGLSRLLDVGLVVDDGSALRMGTSSGKKAAARAAKADEPVAPVAQHTQALSAGAVAKLWNEHADKGLSRIISLEGQRYTFTKARAEQYSADQVKQAIEKMNSSPGLLGKANGNKPGYSGWKANFDWFVRAGTISKLLEGKYDQWGAKASGSRIVGSGEQMYHDE